MWKINETNGVSTVVYAAGNSPFPINEAIIEELRSKCDPLGEIYRSGPPKARLGVSVGQRVRFGESSPFFGLYAELINVSANDTLKVRLEEQFFGSDGREVDAEPKDIEVVDAVS